MYGSARMFLQLDTYYLDLEQQAYNKIKQKIDIENHLKEIDLSIEEQSRILMDNTELQNLKDELED